MTTKPLFESEPCGRCGGCGRYSFNQMDGDRCYGCGGTGVKLTKRGAAARAFYVASQQMAVADLKVGMCLWDDMFGKRAQFLPILSIAPSESYTEYNGERSYYTNITTRRCTLGVLSGSTVRAVRDEEQRQAQLAAALAYQATLTKTGKPAKRAAKTQEPA